MTEILAFCLLLIVCVRTVGYGIWTLSGKNITGGVFVLLMSLGTLSLGAYLLLFGGA